MRTTVTLDEDVAARLKEEMQHTGKSFKETVNEYLRLGFVARKEMKPRKKFVVRPFPLGLPPGLSYDCVWKLIDDLDRLPR